MKGSFIQTRDGFTFSIYPNNSALGEYGSIRYFGNGGFKCKVAQRWRIFVVFTIVAGDKEIEHHSSFDIKEKEKLSDISSTIESHLNDTLSKYRETYLIELDGTDKEFIFYIKSGSVTGFVLKRVR